MTWLGVGAIAAPALAAPPPATTQAPGEPLPFRSLEPGLTLFGVWEVEAVHLIQGAVAVHLRDGADHFRLNVLKRDDSGIPGVGQSRSLSIYVCNHGGPTEEREGQAARALGEWLEHYEATGLPVPKLVTLRQHAIAQL
ncbi:MAG: hypothetical protein Q8L48_08070 [Archangium sp.]|nr:hypothetical protein [Archangium sp.]